MKYYGRKSRRRIMQEGDRTKQLAVSQAMGILAGGSAIRDDIVNRTCELSVGDEALPSNLSPGDLKSSIYVGTVLAQGVPEELIPLAVAGFIVGQRMAQEGILLEFLDLRKKSAEGNSRTAVG